MRMLRVRGITRPVWVLSVVSFLADISGELIYPVVPLFVTGTLGAPAAAVGAIEGIAEGMANLARLATGRVSDRIAARKPFILAGYGLGAAGKLVVGLAFAWPVALLGRSIDRFGKGVRGAPRDALLSEAAEEHYRGRVFGFHRSMDTLGAILGPLAGLALIAAGVPLRWVILAAVVPGVASTFALRWLSETRAHRPRAERQRDSVTRGPKLPVAFYLMLGATALFMLGNSSDAFLILRSKDLGLSTTLAVLAYVIYNTIYAALSFPAGVISDRIPRVVLLVCGYVIFAGVYFGFALAGGSGAVWGLFAIYGAYIAFTDGISKAFISDLVPSSARSSALGLFQGTTGLAALAASVAAGFLWDYVSVRAPFVLGASCALAAALVIALLAVTGALNRPSQALAEARPEPI